MISYQTRAGIGKCPYRGTKDTSGWEIRFILEFIINREKRKEESYAIARDRVRKRMRRSVSKHGRALRRKIKIEEHRN